MVEWRIGVPSMIDSDPDPDALSGFERFWRDLLRRQREQRREKWRLELVLKLLAGARSYVMQEGFNLN